MEVRSAQVMKSQKYDNLPTFLCRLGAMIATKQIVPVRPGLSWSWQ